MSRIELPEIPTDALHAQATTSGDALELALSGTADLRVKDGLDAILACVHERALALGARVVDVNLRALEFMSSACFKAFVTWLANLQSVEAGRRYAVVLRSDPALAWQRRSLHALASFAPGLVQVAQK